MDHKAKGNEGEDMACQYLESEGYEILERNYRAGRSEIDIIALRENSLLVFVEVKVRTGDQFGEPETFVSENQIEKIRSAAEEYIHGINWQKDIRFDILSIDANHKIRYFQDAFY